MAAQVFLGTELKLNVNIEPIGSVTMDEYDFEIEVYCSPKRTISINKEEAIRVDANNYIVLVDTEVIGAGDLKCKVKAEIPDADFDDRRRTEIVAVETGIQIVKTI